jgi:hypothetical protein
LHLLYPVLDLHLHFLGEIILQDANLIIIDERFIYSYEWGLSVITTVFFLPASASKILLLVIFVLYSSLNFAAICVINLKYFV